MTAKIDSLAEDLQNVIGSANGLALAKDAGIQIGALVAKKMEKALARVDRPRQPNVLFPSELGHPCIRKTWYDLNYDGLSMHPKEVLLGKTRIKFSYGDIIEAMIVPLIAVAGHEVTDVNKRVEWEVPGKTGWTVRGNMDCRVDGHIVDVKSMNGFSYNKWLADADEADKFGYAYQLGAYVYGDEVTSMEPQLPPVILGVNKEDGAIGTFNLTPKNAGRAAIARVEALELHGPHIARRAAVPMGKGGNMKLDTICSYCAYKAECWKDSNRGKGLRKFIYSTGPVFLTEVGDEPRVPEVPV